MFYINCIHRITSFFLTIYTINENRKEGIRPNTPLGKRLIFSVDFVKWPSYIMATSAGD